MVIINALTTILVLPFLTSFKNGLYNVIEDEDSWTVELGLFNATFCSGVYGILTLCTLSMMVRLRRSYTGLKWDPSTLAAQISLIQGSNVARAFRNFHHGDSKSFRKRLETLGSDYGIVRLGYWQDKAEPFNKVYGMRFMTMEAGELKCSNFCVFNMDDWSNLVSGSHLISIDAPESTTEDDNLHDQCHGDATTSPYLKEGKSFGV